MDNNKSKILTIVAGVISLIGVFFMLRVIMVGDDTLKSDASAQGIVSGFITFSVILLIAVAAITVILSLVALVKNPQNLKKTLMGLAVLGVILAITYFTASDAAVLDGITGNVIKDGEAGSTSQWVSALINFTGILGAAGLVTIGAGVVKNLIK
tara:strand:- start:74290 stop:74751 length:462 start_codon:yes stop_codon:yes gene_type:complete